MPVIQWNDSFKVGIDEFDTDHKRLVHLLNETYDCFISARAREELANILQALIDYAVSHFYSEELLMEAYDFPGFSQHKKEHQYFTTKACIFQKSYFEGKEVTVPEILQFLETWLLNHILNVDSELGTFLNLRY